MTTGYARFALVLGLLSAIGPVAIDMYLPALPTIAADLGTGEGTAQLSLAAFFIALAVGQPVYGPLTDRFGRRRPLLVGLALFVVASLASTLVTSIEALVALRFLQGIGICGATSISRAIVRDRYTGPEAAQLFSLMMLVLGVSPILAPLAGSAVVAFLPWHGIFAAMALVGVIGIVVVVLSLEETLPPERRNRAGLGSMLRDYRLLLRDRRFMGLMLTAAFAQGAFFGYISSSSFFFITLHRLEPWFYSIVFALIAGGLIAVAQFNAPLMRRIGAERMILAATLVNAAATVLLLLATLAGWAVLPVAIALIFVAACTFPVITAPSSVLALDAHGHRAGTASALMGTLQFAAGALGGGLISLFFDGTSLPMVIVMAGAAVLSLITARLTFRQPRRLADAAVVPAE